MEIPDNLPDEKLPEKLRSIRGCGRNEWSIEAMWNSFIASFLADEKRDADGRKMQTCAHSQCLYKYLKTPETYISGVNIIIV